MTSHALSLTPGSPLVAPGLRPPYSDLSGWQGYQGFFPETMRSNAETTPSEEWWSWNGIDVHLDRLPVPDARLKVIVLHGAGAYGRVMAPPRGRDRGAQRIRDRVP